ncbi:transposase family protein [Streptomyces sp. MNU77]|uniref:helix-turn-helix domain-containing protein n=1 Tax=Streptomyces sp. MNU77 TaxID=1573406 RepID=UPI00273F768A|nr:transposase family protein [Streptomyces sp. MNU77]
MFVDRVLVTLAHLRHDLPHSALAVLLGVDRSTVSAAIRQVRPLLTARGFAVPDQPAIRLRTIEERAPAPRPRTSSCVSTAPTCR